MPEKQHKWRERPLEIVHNGRRYVPIARNGFFSPNYCRRFIAGVTIDGQTYKVGTTTIPADRFGGGRRFRYVCAADLQRIAQAIQESQQSQRAIVAHYVMERAEHFRSHHITYTALLKQLRTKFGFRLSRHTLTSAVRLCKEHDPAILIGERHVHLVCKLLEEQPDLRIATSLYRTIQRAAEQRYHCVFTSQSIKRAVTRFDEKYGHPTERVDRNEWATLEEAAAFLRVSRNTILGLSQKKRLESAGLLYQCTYVTWLSLRAYKEKRDDYIRRFPRRVRLQPVVEGESELPPG